MYAGNPRTLKRITEVWVPELQRLGVKVPLLLVGCKSDLRPHDQNMQQVCSYQLFKVVKEIKRLFALRATSPPDTLNVEARA